MIFFMNYRLKNDLDFLMTWDMKEARESYGALSAHIN